MDLYTWAQQRATKARLWSMGNEKEQGVRGLTPTMSIIDYHPASVTCEVKSQDHRITGTMDDHHLANYNRTMAQCS